ncbi:MAG TPA: hypothetical protein VFH56_09725 [Acidimicrobiales bacterium]|nr:hypothetical protein [Acidimicrobiales bacterium]
MRKLLAIIAAGVPVLGLNVASAGASPAATVNHYTASYTCDCFGHFNLSGVHLTNHRFAGVDNGPTATTTTGGRDNYSGTVSEPPQTDTTISGPGGTTCDPNDMWESDYNPNLFTCTWSMTVDSNGVLSGWAIYPAGS